MGQVFYKKMKMGSSRIQQNADTRMTASFRNMINVPISKELRKLNLFLRLPNSQIFEAGFYRLLEKVHLKNIKLPMNSLLAGKIRTSVWEIPPRLQVFIKWFY